MTVGDSRHKPHRSALDPSIKGWVGRPRPTAVRQDSPIHSRTSGGACPHLPLVQADLEIRGPRLLTREARTGSRRPSPIHEKLGGTMSSTCGSPPREFRRPMGWQRIFQLPTCYSPECCLLFFLFLTGGTGRKWQRSPPRNPPAKRTYPFENWNSAIGNSAIFKCSLSSIP